MAATTSVIHHDDRHQRNSASAQRPVPGSPTLTNPDMILPDYDPPDSPEGVSQSHVTAWGDPNLDKLDFQLPPQANFASGSMANTPIIYGNGTMLSDIGEVTEAESTVGPGSRRTSSRYSGQVENETYGVSPFIIGKGAQLKSRPDSSNRRSSIDSNSTITTQEQRRAFGEFDDSVSVDDSNFQGDDEESMASSYVEGMPARRKMSGQEEDRGAQYSTTFISSRAEQILANAKRRLTAMEGNLNRARSSLSQSDGSTPSPQLGRPASAADKGMGLGSGHARMRSDDAARETSKQPRAFIPRSASALGAAGGYRPPSSRPQRAGSAAARPTHGLSQHPLDTTLEPLGEDDDAETISNVGSAREGHDQFSAQTTPTFGTFPDFNPLTRSASVAQMRDIQDQMQGLRGKISTLKEQARADSMKRRSLQSLRTPSPFTHARWDQGHMEPRDIRSVQATEEEDGRADMMTPEAGHRLQDKEPEEHQQPALQDERSTVEMKAPEEGVTESAAQETEIPVQADVVRQEEVTDHHEQGSQPADYTDDMHTEHGDNDSQYQEEFNDAEENFPDTASDSGESLYHDSYQNQMSHEDREDAFDYEHFFLHSAMGSISRQGRAEDTESEFSESSVETTKGPSSRMGRGRYSIDTSASDDTFQTATEGRASRSSAFRSAMGGAADDGVDELEPLHEVRSVDGEEDDQYDSGGSRKRQNSVLHRPTSAARAERLQRPSIASFESTGTTRSFPLLNKSKINDGILTPGESPDPTAKHMLGANVNGGPGGTLSAPSLHGMAKEDQVAVQKLVASLGECVLELGEATEAGPHADALRRRIDAARRILEGHEQS